MNGQVRRQMVRFCTQAMSILGTYYDPYYMGKTICSVDVLVQRYERYLTWLSELATSDPKAAELLGKAPVAL